MKKWIFIVSWYSKTLIPIPCTDKHMIQWSILPETDRNQIICVEKREGFKSMEFIKKEDALDFIQSRPDNSMGLEITKVHLREMQE